MPERYTTEIWITGPWLRRLSAGGPLLLENGGLRLWCRCRSGLFAFLLFLAAIAKGIRDWGRGCGLSQTGDRKHKGAEAEDREFLHGSLMCGVGRGGCQGGPSRLWTAGFSSCRGLWPRLR